MPIDESDSRQQFEGTVKSTFENFNLRKKGLTDEYESRITEFGWVMWQHASAALSPAVVKQDLTTEPANTGDATRDQAIDQCRAIRHMAAALIEVIADRERWLRAGTPVLMHVFGRSSAATMESLGDILNGMDAVLPEDSWLDPIFERAHQMFPAQATVKDCLTVGAPQFDIRRVLFRDDRMPGPDEHGPAWSHPDLDMFCAEEDGLTLRRAEDEGSVSEKLLRAAGFESAMVSMESDLDEDHPVYSRYYHEDGDFAGWNPTRPAGDGWKQVGQWDTEDGPYAMFVRQIECVSNSYTLPLLIGVAVDRAEAQIAVMNKALRDPAYTWSGRNLATMFEDDWVAIRDYLRAAPAQLESNPYTLPEGMTKERAAKVLNLEYSDQISAYNHERIACVLAGAREAARLAAPPADARDAEADWERRLRLFQIGRAVEREELDDAAAERLGLELQRMSRICPNCRGSGTDGDPPDSNGEGGGIYACAQCDGKGEFPAIDRAMGAKDGA